VEFAILKKDEKALSFRTGLVSLVEGALGLCRLALNHLVPDLGEDAAHLVGASANQTAVGEFRLVNAGAQLLRVEDGVGEGVEERPCRLAVHRLRSLSTLELTHDLGADVLGAGEARRTLVVLRQRIDRIENVLHLLGVDLRGGENRLHFAEGLGIDNLLVDGVESLFDETLHIRGVLNLETVSGLRNLAAGGAEGVLAHHADVREAKNEGAATHRVGEDDAGAMTGLVVRKVEIVTEVGGDERGRSAVHGCDRLKDELRHLRKNLVTEEVEHLRMVYGRELAANGLADGEDVVGVGADEVVDVGNLLAVNLVGVGAVLAHDNAVRPEDRLGDDLEVEKRTRFAEVDFLGEVSVVGEVGGCGGDALVGACHCDSHDFVSLFVFRRFVGVSATRRT